MLKFKSKKENNSSIFGRGRSSFPKKIIELFVVLMLLIPHLFLNIQSTHDWGDDFALYITEGKNLAEGEPVGKTNYIINKNVVLGPQNYPVGFPLLIAPIIKSSGINYSNLIRYQSVFIICALILSFVFFRMNFAFWSSALLTCLLGYSPGLISFKAEVLSDISFWLFLNIIVIIVLKNKSLLGFVALGIITGFIIHIRTVGYVLVLSTLLYWIINDVKTKTLKSNLQKYLLYGVSLLVIFLGLKILFPVNSAYSFIGEGLNIDRVARRVSYNIFKLQEFFKAFTVIDYYFIPIVFAAFFITFLLLGIAVELKKNLFSFVNILTGIFIFTIIIYQFTDAGIRFIFPLITLFIYYFAVGIRQTFLKLELKNNAVIFLLAIIYMITFYRPIQQMQIDSREALDGPETKEFKDVLGFLKSNKIQNKIIAFNKPRALALYSNNKTVAIADTCFKKDVDHFKPDYFLISDTQSTSVEKKSVLDTSAFKIIFDNSAFKLYEIKYRD
jgi:hypothetical protein